MNTIDLILQLAAKTYGTSLRSFRPWISTYERNNVIAEANITFHIARAFCAALPDAHAFLEREFRKERDAKSTSLKLDAYLTSPELALLFEAKVLVDSTTMPKVLDDIDRASADVAQQQLSLHTGAKPLETKGLVVAECWKPSLHTWWTEGAAMQLKDQLAGSTLRRTTAIDEGWRFEFIEVGSFDHGSTAPAAGTHCFWLYAVGPSHTPHCIAA